MTLSIEPPGVPVSTRTTPVPPTPHVPLTGQSTTLEPLTKSHSPSLFTHFGGAPNADLWTYIPLYPLTSQAECDAQVQAWMDSKDPQYYAIVPRDTGEATGVMSYLNIVPEHRRVEIGWIMLGHKLQRTKAATETFYLAIKNAFDLGYQRVEWKANALNRPSLAAAERLGFVPEGIFRKHVIVKGKWRDTAWFSITDDEWPAVKAGFEAWLDPSNFDEEGKQKRGLKECREASK